jgi:fibronectin-binding autotransporter adhesin
MKMPRVGAVVAVSGLLAVVGSTSSALGQFVWNNGAGGVWNSSLNWNPSGFPNTSTATALIDLPGTYIVTVQSPITIASLNVANANATVNVNSGNLLQLNTASALNLDGRMVINPQGAVSNTYLGLGGPAIPTVTLSGGGTITLNAVGDLNRAYIIGLSGSAISSSLTINGSGNLYGNYTNTGTINANVTGAALNFVSTSTMNNRNVLSATNGGTLSMASTTVNQLVGPGRMIADGGALQLNAVTINGGSLERLNNGSFNFAGTITLNGVNVIGSFDIPASVFVAIPSGNFVHDGTITINPTGAVGSTALRFDAAGAFAGIGQTILNASGTDLNRAYVQANGAPGMTHGAARVLRGSGNIYGAWINEGVINADAPGRTLQFVNSVTQNNRNLFTATNGGTLNFAGGTINQQTGPGRIVANGGIISLNNNTIQGGTIEFINGGTLAMTGNVTLNGTSVLGSFGIPNASAIIIPTAGFTHDGTITINPTGGATSTYLQFDAGGTFDGTGETVLNAVGADLNRAYVQANGAAVTHGANRVLRGSGFIYGQWINDGIIRSDQAGRNMQFTTFAAQTNRNLISAVNGATLGFSGGSLNQSVGPGRLVADGGTVNLSSMSVTGGSVEAINGGTVNLNGQTTYNGVTHLGPINIPNAGTLIIAGSGFSHNGTITINASGGANNTVFRFDQAGTFAGTGTTVLNTVGTDLNAAYIQANGVAMVHGPNRVLRGSGNIYGQWTNQGIVQADIPGKVLQLFSSGVTTNNQNLLTAINGATLQINGQTISQTSGARTVADGGIVSLQNASFNGGSLEAINGGSFNVNGALTLSNLQLLGPLNIPSSASLTFGTMPFVHDGVITMNSNGGVAQSVLRFNLAGNVGGAGTIHLNATGGDVNRANINVSAGIVTFGPDRTLSGSGILYGAYVNNGTISPSGSLRQINIASSLTMGSTSKTKIVLGGRNTGQFSRIVGGTINLGGSVEVELVDGFEPAAVDQFTFLTASVLNGNFNTFIPPVGSSAFRLIRNNNNVTLLAYSRPCQPADIADDQGTPLINQDRNINVPSNGVNEGDFNCFFNTFFLPAPENAACDIADDQGTALPPFDVGGTNGAANNGVNEGDYNCFFNNFFLPCP